MRQDGAVEVDAVVHGHGRWLNHRSHIVLRTMHTQVYCGS